MIRVGGIVLCGGQSRRMGRSKAWLPFGEEVMLSRVVRLLSQVVDPIVVVAAPEQTVPPLPTDVVICRDEVFDRGPLQGLLAGLNALEGKVDAAYLSSCDVPFLNPRFVFRLLELLEENSICVPFVEGYHHPLAAIYRTEIKETVKSLLEENRLRPIYLFDRVSTRIVTPSDLEEIDPTFQSLRNLNTPEEYEKALKDLVSK